MTGESSFQRYIPEAASHDGDVAGEQGVLVKPEEVKRHILCTGQVYYTLLQAREERGIRDVAISRIEQVSPFPYDMVRFFFGGFWV